MNEPFKKRRGRVGALTVVLAALFVLVALRLAALVVFDGPRLTSLARSEHTARSRWRRRAGRSRIAMASRSRFRPRRDRSMRGRRN